MAEFATGLIPRDYEQFPSGYMESAPSAPDDWLVPEDEWDERLADQQANKASMWDLREDNYDILRSLNQGSYKLCWAFSTTKVCMYIEAIMGTPIILSPWYMAGISNGWRNQGGWGAQSLASAAKVGTVPMEFCPQFSSGYDTAANRSLAGKRKVIEWFDGSQDTSRNRAMAISAFLLGPPPVLDFNALAHSMAGCRLVALKPRLIIDCDNSWSSTEQHGAKGTYRLVEPKINGIVVPRIIMPSD